MAIQLLITVKNIYKMSVLINKVWYRILRIEGSLALVQFESGNIVWNIKGLETKRDLLSLS